MLELAVFLCGAAVMVVELDAARLLAPFLGTSVVVWTSVIGVILAAMSLGYWWGGRLADRRPTLAALSWVIVFASLATALVAFARHGLLLAGAAGPRLGALLASAGLFAPSALLLGMVAPWAARIRLTDQAEAGRTVGRLYALSTLGSIVGTFAGGYFLIAALGSSDVLLVTAAVLALAALSCHRGEALAKVGLAVGYVCLIAFSRADARALESVGFHDTDTVYQRVLVYPAKQPGSDRPMRVMSTGPEGVQGGMFPDAPTELALSYARFFRLSEHFRPDAARVLVLGGGSYAYPKYSLAHRPQTLVDVVELDPGVTALAEKHFDFRPDPRVRVIHQDARVFLNANTARYDVVLGDVFHSSVSIPFHLTTVQAARRIHAALNDEGVALINVVAARQGLRAGLLASLVATYRAVFPQVWVLAVHDTVAPDAPQNFIVALFKSKTPREWTSPDPRMNAMLAASIDVPTGVGELVLTDDFAPVERFVPWFGGR